MQPRFLVVTVLGTGILCGSAVRTASAQGEPRTTVAGGTLAFHGSAGVVDWIWGLGALVAVLSAGILTFEAVRAPATAEDI